MGALGFNFSDVEEIMTEINNLTPIYKGIIYERIENEGIQWPCPSSDHPGTKILHTSKFPTLTGKAKLLPLIYIPSVELPDKDFPLLLTTDRSLYHYHTSTMTRRVRGLNLLDKEELLKINPLDAASLQIGEGEIVKVTSRRGEVRVKTKITSIIPVGIVSMTFHFWETPTNELTNGATDPVAKIPETKVCAIKIEKIL
jgi:formate dehydrogenase alpha subunit